MDGTAVGSANNGTNWANAWTNFSSITFDINPEGSHVGGSVAAGDTVFISGGSSSKIYSVSNFPATSYGAIITFGMGMTNSPITIKPGEDFGHNGTVIFDGEGDTRSDGVQNWDGVGVGLAKYCTIDGGTNKRFFFQNFSNTNYNIGAGWHRREYTKAISGNGEGLQVKNIIISNCANGMRLTGNYIIVSYCNLYKIRGDCGIYVLPSSGGQFGLGSVHHCWIQGTTMPNGVGGGPDSIGPGEGVDVYNCELRCDELGDVIPPGDGLVMSQHPDGVQSSGGVHRIYNNIFHNMVDSSISGDPSTAQRDWYIWNNVFFSDNTNFTVGACLQMGGQTGATLYSNIYWMNNTFVDYDFNAGCIGYSWLQGAGELHPYATNFNFYNNIFYRCGRNSLVELGGSKISTNMHTSDFGIVGNLFYISEGGTNNFNFGRDLTGSTNWTQVPLLSGKPSFQVYSRFGTNSNFRLSSNDTAAKNQGTNLTALFTILNLSSTDLDGNLRPASGNWSIGAYEYQPFSQTLTNIIRSTSARFRLLIN